MPPSTLTSHVTAFITHLCAPLDLVPTIKHQVIKHKPITVRIGVEGMPPTALRDLFTGDALRAAWESVFPPSGTPVHGGLDPKSLVASADNKSLLMDLVFLGVTLTEEPELQHPASSI